MKIGKFNAKIIGASTNQKKLFEEYLNKILTLYLTYLFFSFYRENKSFLFIQISKFRLLLQ